MNQIRKTGDVPGAEELDLARNAAAGDGAAFAALYNAYEKRIYNYCLRLLSDKQDAEDATQEAFVRVLKRLPDMAGKQFEFGPYLFTSARNTSYDMIEKRKRTQPSGDITEDLDAHLHRDRAGVETDPVRSAMLGAQRDSVSAANSRLPVRQREVLALREVEGMSYAEIATTMDLNSNSVAQLISRARTNLRSEVRLDVAASVAPVSADCEQALPLLAMRQDGELDSPERRIWLETHLTGCSGCQVANEEMAEAGVSYRAWVPVIPAAYLFRNTLAKAAATVGADWSGVERPVGGAEADPESGSDPVADPSRGKFRALVTTAVVLVIVGVAYLAAAVDDATRDADPVEPPSVETSVVKAKKQPARKKARKKRAVETTVPQTATPAPATVPSGVPATPGSSGQVRSPRPSGGGGNQGGGSNNPSTPPDPPANPTPPPVDPPVTTPPTQPPTTTPPTRPTPPNPPTPPPNIKG
ncbi:MAG: sigma-70 family RNA polymerase sigma factor [Solirubrobacterales bacterium]|nr:sigma-70 family RNA polymerase sigma factor [Solirubrobacterales bacterium]